MPRKELVAILSIDPHRAKPEDFAQLASELMEARQLLFQASEELSTALSRGGQELIPEIRKFLGEE